MKARQIINFPAIFRDGQLLACATDFGIDCSDVRIIGEKTEKAWDADKWKFMNVTGFFLAYKGIEYGSIDMTEEEFFTACAAICCGDGGGDNFRIHVTQFVREFV